MRKLGVAGALLLMLVVGWIAGRWFTPAIETESPTTASSSCEEVLYWQAPMDPNYRRDEPGLSPMGMELVAVCADDEDESGVVQISPQVVANLGVRTASVERGTLSRVIDTVGYVGFDEETLTQVNTRVDGWIERLGVKSTGERVERGQVLFEIYSPTLVSAQEEYLAALTSNSSSLLAASRDRLLYLGMTPNQVETLTNEGFVRDRVSVFAASSGFVASLHVREGVHVNPHTTVMSLSELDTIWVLAEVFERDSPWVEEGQRTEVRLDYLPGRVWAGTVDYLYPELDARTRTSTVRVRFDNPDETLRPNMFARVLIYGSETEPTLHIPRAAIIRGGVADRVVLALGDGRFRSQVVEVGMEAGDRVEIRSGLSLDDQIVVSGQFLIDSESNIDAEFSRLNQSDPESASVEQESRANVSAVVVALEPEQSAVRLQHEAIPAWDWPAMTMSLPVVDLGLLEELEVGSSVQVTIERAESGAYVVIAIELQPMVHDH